jgi:hypothetical protein
MNASRITLIAALATATGLAQAQTASPQPRLELGVTTRSVTEIRTGPARKNLYLVVEGAGKFTLQGTVIAVHALCAAVDTLVEGHKTVYAGVGDCEFRSAAGGILYAQFKTPEGKGDRARMMLSGGTLDLARFNGGAVPMIALINPHVVGKPVFYFDSTDEKTVGN